MPGPNNSPKKKSVAKNHDKALCHLMIQIVISLIHEVREAGFHRPKSN